jgi:hypothetical protein
VAHINKNSEKRAMKCTVRKILYLAVGIYRVNLSKVRSQERKLWQNTALLSRAFGWNSTNVCKIQENTKFSIALTGIWLEQYKRVKNPGKHKI